MLSESQVYFTFLRHRWRGEGLGEKNVCPSGITLSACCREAYCTITIDHPGENHIEWENLSLPNVRVAACSM